MGYTYNSWAPTMKIFFSIRHRESTINTGETTTDNRKKRSQWTIVDNDNQQPTLTHVNQQLAITNERQTTIDNLNTCIPKSTHINTFWSLICTVHFLPFHKTSKHLSHLTLCSGALTPIKVYWVYYVLVRPSIPYLCYKQIQIVFAEPHFQWCMYSEKR
jgi:hypothetical protein